MIISRHADGRVLVIAYEHGIRPMLKTAEGWGLVGRRAPDARDFKVLLDPVECQTLLSEAIADAQKAEQGHQRLLAEARASGLRTYPPPDDLEGD